MRYFIDKGLYGKFHVERVDGQSAPGKKHYGCDYFVLDLTHDRFAVPAIEAYAAACMDTKPELAKDLERWVSTKKSQGGG